MPQASRFWSWCCSVLPLPVSRVLVSLSFRSFPLPLPALLGGGVRPLLECRWGRVCCRLSSLPLREPFPLAVVPVGRGVGDSVSP